jgi:hypothetical protein
MAAAGAVLLGLSPLLFAEPPPGLKKARPFVYGCIGVAFVLLLVEWLGIH